MKDHHRKMVLGLAGLTVLTAGSSPIQLSELLQIQQLQNVKLRPGIRTSALITSNGRILMQHRSPSAPRCEKSKAIPLAQVPPHSMWHPRVCVVALFDTCWLQQRFALAAKPVLGAAVGSLTVVAATWLFASWKAGRQVLSDAAHSPMY